MNYLAMMSAVCLEMLATQIFYRSAHPQSLLILIVTAWMQVLGLAIVYYFGKL